MARAALIVALLAAAVAVVASQGTEEPTAAPTPVPLPATCPVSARKIDAQYRAPGGCRACRSSSSPFIQNYGGITCVPPTTLTARSRVCTNAVHPAFILTNIAPRRSIVGCINPTKQTVRIVFPMRNSDYDFLNGGGFIGDSIFLDGTIPRNGDGNGRIVTIGGIRRVYFSFTAPDTLRFRRKAGRTVQITGAWRRGDLLNICFVSYLSICG